MSALLCMSHTPLMPFAEPPPGVRAATESAIAGAAEALRRFDPELVVIFGPDHYNGFFYDLMPAFCIGTQASAIGDFDTPAGALSVDAQAAKDCAAYVLAHGVEVGVSHRMRVDHGFSQPLEKLVGTLDRYPVLPVFVNSVAPPFGPIRRVRELGRLVGEFTATLGRRTLFIGSGGLSHNPPVPRIADAPPEVAARLIDGRNPTPEARQARQARTIAAGKAFAAGSTELAPLNPDWDRGVMDTLAAGDWARVDGWANDWIEREGGASAHEIRCWIAAFAALAAHGPYRAQVRYYAAIKEWIAGFGIMEATSAA
jgi:2,3-dihydroxyphenylpropionate 1,2-dioxygenase